MNSTLYLIISYGIQFRARLRIYDLKMRLHANTVLGEELDREKPSNYQWMLCAVGKEFTGYCSPFPQNPSCAECSKDIKPLNHKRNRRGERQRTKYICWWDLEKSQENEVTRYSWVAPDGKIQGANEPCQNWEKQKRVITASQIQVHNNWFSSYWLTAFYAGISVIGYLKCRNVANLVQRVEGFERPLRKRTCLQYDGNRSVRQITCFFSWNSVYHNIGKKIVKK